MFFKKKKTEQKADIAAESKIVDNNLKGQELEKAGNIEKAKKLYEENIAKDFDGNHPYDRLAIIYRKEKDYDNEIRVLEHAIKVFTSLSKSSPRGDVNPKLTKFKDRLKKVQELKLKDAQ
ncbi:MAG: tetratricopeptide repeat protein [Vallitaleaceae bacterium]|nr:tetratricopeptide repeat protein [Vallitaleaceae bacterium]